MTSSHYTCFATILKGINEQKTWQPCWLLVDTTVEANEKSFADCHPTWPP